jgi:cellulose synthase/poly-beta-1,6-N-acetylglucosamine synthase-like glycosyltransferase
MNKKLRRLWEILPGLMTWLTFLVSILLAIFYPTTLSILVLLYVIYWLIKVFIITGFLAAGYTRFRKERRINWYEKLNKDFGAQYKTYYHVAIVPTYKEDISILRRTLDSVKDSNYDNDKIIVVVAFEEREKQFAPEYAKILTHEYEHVFNKFLTTFHPAEIPGEVKGKGPNITWAGKKMLEYINQQKISYDNVIVTTLDADNRTDPNYFANLQYAYLSDPDPIHKSFQPLPMFFNNIWKVPFPVKVTALGSSFWQMIQAMRPYFCRNFSAHAQSLAALVETDFWSVKTVVEDGHQYWRSYFRFNGNHHVVPIFVPIYMDAVQGEHTFDTFREQYLQRRRWFWGVSDIPFVFEHSYGNNRIPFFYKWLQFARLVESHYSLATQSFILLIGWLPLVINPAFQESVLGYNFPITYRAFLTAAWIGLVVNITVASMLVPPKPGKKSHYILTLMKEWVLSPIMLTLSGIFFSALPAIDSQTRLMLNKPFTVFNVTKKTAIPSGTLQVD